MRRRRLKLAGIAAATAALALFGGGASAAASPRVLVVGDSLEELTSPYLAGYLSGVTLTVNAVGGSNTYEIFDLFQESYDPSQSVIVFDGGTNDNPAYPEILAGNLQKVAEEVGERCMVVPTIHGYTVNGIDNTGKNRTVAQFAASRPGTQTPDWAGAVETQPQLLLSDGLHPTQEGSEYRAQLIAQGIEGCLDYDRARTTTPAPRAQPKPPPLAGRIERRRAALVRALAMEILEEGAARALAGAFLAGH
jgi:hypothetical protein